MKPTCQKCYYYCKIPFKEDKYDYSRSFCGLHGSEEIKKPNEEPPNLMHKQNEKFNCMCGFIPLNKEKEPIQLTLF